MYNKTAFYKQRAHHSDNYSSCRASSAKAAWRESFNNSLGKPPANVKELDDKFELHLIAPGYVKSDFQISVSNNTLSIKVEKDKMENEEWKRLEYRPKSFMRSFELSESIELEKIIAKYEQGILILELPKLEGFHTSQQQIEVE